MPTTRRIRKMFLGLGILLLALIVLLAALPLWLPWILRPVTRSYGVHYSNYQRAGYSRFVLTNLRLTNETIRFQAGQAEGFVPTVWLWLHSFGSKDGQKTFWRVADWQLEILDTTKKPPPSAPSLYRSVQKTDPVLSALQAWMPRAVLSNGTVQVKGQSVQVPSALWDRGALTAQLVAPKYNQRGTLKGARTGRNQYEFVLDSESLFLTSNVRISETASGLNVQSTNFWRSNRVTATAEFGRQGALPKRAQLEAASFVIPAEVLKLDQYQDLAGSLSFRWEQDQLTADLTATAHPLQTAPRNLPPVELVLHATGDTQSAQIETARVLAPWLNAQLSQPVKINFRGPLLLNPVTLQLAADLSRQTWVPASGSLEGEAIFTPVAEKYPDVSFSLSGSRIESRDVKIKTVTTRGNLSWPWLEISKTDVALADGSTVTLAGKMEVQKQIIRDGQLKFKGPFGRQWLPAGYSCDEAGLSLAFSGPWKKVSHAGQLEVKNFSSPLLHPLQLKADWKGEWMDWQAVEIVASAGQSSLLFQGAFAVTDTNLTVNTLSFRQNGRPALELEKPFQISLPALSPGTNAAARPWLAKCGEFHWLGPGQAIRLEGEVAWPQHGKIASSVQALDVALFADFLKLPATNLPSIASLNFSAEWNQGPATLALNLSSTATAKDGAPFSAEVSLSGNREGLSMEKLSVTSRSEPVFTAEGFLPLTFTPDSAQSLVRFLPDKALRLTARTQTNSIFWETIAATNGLILRQPRLNADISGTLAAPQGRVEVEAQQIRLPLKKWEIPPLDQVQATLVLDRGKAQVENLKLFVEGQPVTLTGEIPLGEKFWTELPAKRSWPDWDQGTARLKIQDAQLAAFAPLFPKVLSRQGTVNADLALLPGAKLDGELTVSGARTRPLATVGPVQDIQVKIKFAGRGLLLESASATLGGAAVTASGSADLRGTDWMKGVMPPFQIQLQGRRVPLARQPDVIARGDINAAISKTNSAPPMILGTVRLADCYYLRDLRDLIPGGVARPQQRPPYFSVETGPLADWGLGLSITGEKFLKVQSPLFRGTLSANLKLAGTLKDPIALGELKIDSGAVRFPFGNLQVAQGFITLTSEDPYRPQLVVTANSRRYGYDVRMELTGPADAPLLQFSSTPPLSSEQIVTMLTTGELPRGDFSLTPQQRAQALAVFLGKGLLTQLGLSSDSERLTIQSGEQAPVEEGGKSTYYLEFKLSQRWSLVAEYTRFNEFNAGLKWRIYSR